MGKKSLEARKIFEETSLDGILSPEDFIKRREMMLHGMFPDSDLVPGIFSSLRFFHLPHAIASLYRFSIAECSPLLWILRGMSKFVGD